MEIKVALAQMEIALGDVERNVATAQRMAAKAAAQGADLLVLPELWSTGYDLARADAYAAALGQGAFGLMADLAKEAGLYVAGTALETNPQGLPFNTAALYTPDGELAGAYQKVHLWAPLGEVEHMTAGVRLPFLTCHGGGWPWRFATICDSLNCGVVTPMEGRSSSSSPPSGRSAVWSTGACSCERGPLRTSSLLPAVIGPVLAPMASLADTRRLWILGHECSRRAATNRDCSSPHWSLTRWRDPAACFPSCRTGGRKCMVTREGGHHARL